jgi:hypothetical protein
MADNRTDVPETPNERAPGEDPRKEWVPPAISELPISETQGVAGQGADNGQYS